MRTTEHPSFTILNRSVSGYTLSTWKCYPDVPVLFVESIMVEGEH